MSLSKPLRAYLTSALLSFGAIFFTACLGPTESGLRSYRSGDYEGAVEKWLPAAEAGEARAQFVMGLVHEKGEGVALDLREAATWYELAAEQGFAPAQNNLGLLHYHGDGMPRSYEDAALWFEKAVAQDFAPAQTNLGVMYLTGQGVELDTERGEDLVEAASDQGDRQARLILSHLAAKDSEGSLGLMRAAEGVRSERESDSEEPNMEFSVIETPDLQEQHEDNLALNWLARSAREGSLDATVAVGLMLRYGVSADADHEAAAEWLRIAADRQSPSAQCELGLMHLKGEGVEQDDEQAVRWLELSATQGNPVAQHNLALLLARGRGVEQNKALARTWMQRAADGGLGQSHFKLGLMNETADITRGDLGTAYYHFTVASALGHPSADLHREQLADRLLERQRTSAQARAEKWLANEAR